jgi:hypothetical protein
MSKKALVSFLEEQVADAKEQGVLFSLHMKATMMKVSDPIIFGHGVEAFFKPVFAKHGATIAELGVNVKNGFGDLLAKIESLPAEEKAEIEATIRECYENGPDVAMVNSDNGITNLHVPSDVIIDASMPAMIRTSGQMWNAEGNQQDTKAVIPDGSYAGVYAAARNTALSIRRPWEPFPTSGLWLKRRKSTVRTTKPSKSRPTARFAFSIRTETFSPSMPWRRATSGGLVRQRTLPSATGSSLRSLVHEQPVVPQFSGSTKIALTMPS